MFETSVVRDGAQAAPRRAGLLTVSLAAHAIVIVGAVTVGIASVDFPKLAPDQFEMFQIADPVSVPPPLGNPNGGAKPEPQKPEPQKPAPAPPVNQVTAPAVIPEDVTPMEGPSTNAGNVSSDGGPGTGTVPGPVGVPWGDPNSVATDLDLPPVVNTPPVEEKIHVVGGEVKAPVTIHRVEPRFPPALARIRMKAVITVRCVIDKQGNVRDPEVLRSSLPPFNESVVAAVQQWKFRPATLRGQPVDAWFELTVNFDVR